MKEQLIQSYLVDKNEDQFIFDIIVQSVTQLDNGYVLATYSYSTKCSDTKINIDRNTVQISMINIIAYVYDSSKHY